MRGTAAFDVVPLADGRTRVRWIEDIEVAPVALTRVLAPVVATAGRLAFARALRKMGRELVAERAGR